MRARSEKQFQLTLKRFVEELAGPGDGRRLRATTPLFSSGLIDSLKVLDLIVFVEELAGTSIPDQKVTLDNFKSIKAIANSFWQAP